MPARNIFSFASWDRDHPVERPPGDRLDAQFEELLRGQSELSARLDALFRSDGRLRNGIVSRETLAADLADDLIDRFKQGIEPELASATASSRVAEASARAAVVSLGSAAQAAQAAHDDRDRVQELRDTAIGALESLQEEVDLRLRQLRDANIDALDAVNDAQYWANLAFKYCDLAGNWAEHMPDTIPPQTLAVMNISGDHWSSRWWANRAASYWGGAVAWAYLGAYDTLHSPTTTPTGDPLTQGMLYYNTTLNEMMVWNGSFWQPMTIPVPGVSATLFYVAAASQTVFPLTTADMFGHTQTLQPGQGVSVYLNGVRLTPDDGTGTKGDYNVNTSTSTVTLVSAAAAPATWNPADKSAGMTLSGGNLATANNNGANSGVRSTSARSSGKLYFEYTLNTSLTGGIGYDGIGIGSGSAPFTVFPPNQTAGAGAVGMISNGVIFADGSSVGSMGFSLTAGGTVGVALDLTARLVWFRGGAAGNWNASGTANPATGVGGIALPASLAAPAPVYGMAWLANTGDQVTVNFGASAFVGAAPAGFSSWNSSGAGGGAPAGSILAVDALVLASQIAPGVALVKKLKPLTPAPDGVNKVFTLQCVDGSTVSPGTDAQVWLSLDGVDQEASVSFSMSGSQVTFAAPPAVDSAVFGVYFATS